MNWVLARLHEPSTYAGAALVAGAAEKALEALAHGDSPRNALVILALGLVAVIKGEGDSK